jgi:hypothetical protein
LKRVTDKIRSGCGPLIRDCEKWLELGVLNEIGLEFWILVFWGNVRRRGTDVSTPKIGSRGVCLCFGGILGSYADLRREFGWVRLKFRFLGILGVGPRGSGRRGVTSVSSCIFRGI